MTTTPGQVQRGQVARQVVVELPIPSRDVAKGGSSHHWITRRAYNAHRADAGWTIRAEHPVWDTPWAAAYLDVEWCYSRGRPPDDDGAIARLAAYRDGAQDAGLVSDDRFITQRSITFTKVERGDECVRMVFTEKENP